MALTKRLYKNHQTVITAENMNDIQDAILGLEQLAGIVPGERETTKIINVINPAGSLTAAQAAAHPDGLYWVVNPVTFQTEDQTRVFTISGLAAKTGNAWQNYGTGQEGTTDETGVLISCQSTVMARAVNVAIDETGSGYTIEYTDGSTVQGWAEFDEEGNPVSLTDDQGNSVAFSGGYPVSATDSQGHTVDISFE